MVLSTGMHSRLPSARARRLGPLTLLLASCSSLLGIEDPVPRPGCEGDACEGGEGGMSGGTKPVTVAGSDNTPQGGSGGEPTSKLEGGEAGAAPVTNVAGSGEGGGAGASGGAGGAPPECEDDAVRCEIYQPQICKSGHWTNQDPECDLACVDGACQEPASCSAESAPTPCVGGVSCCETIWVPGGDYLMADGDEEDAVNYPRSVSGFYLDRFEVTVDRFQYFQSHYVLPSEGEGAHPKIPGSGWHEAWEDVPHLVVDGRKAVPTDGDDLLLQVTDDCDVSTWSGDDSLRPITCVNWYVAFAFCVWDGGRLPTEAEWNYVAAFGGAQRPYPWSESTSDVNIDSTHATFYDYPALPLLPTPVGSHAAGRGGFSRFSGRGHDDLAGNVYEWSLDQWLDAPPDTCDQDCLAAWGEVGEDRVARGGAYPSDYSLLRSGSRVPAPASIIESLYGFRCARDINKKDE